ncbi:MAG: MFS transporter [Thermodesulfobacteriota bacterium]
MNPAGEANGYFISKKYSYYVFSLLFMLYAFDYIDRLVVVSLFPFLIKDWGLTDAQCGALVSAVYWSIILFTFPVSLLIDRWSRKKVIGLMAVFWSLATAACALTKNFTQLFIARTAIGVGEAGYAPGGTAMISALFPQEKRSLMVGVWNASIPLGSALGVALGGIVAEHFGWRHAFGLVALPGLAVALLFFWIKDYQTVELVKTVQADQGAGGRTRMGTGDIIREFLGTKSLIFTYLAFAGNTFLTTSLLTWLPTYFHRAEGLSMSQAGLKGSVIMLLAIVGAPVGGLLTDLWLKKRTNARMLFSSLASLVTALTFLAAFTLFSGQGRYIVLLLGGMSAAAFSPAAIAVTQDVVHPGLRAISYSFCAITQNILGSSLGPLFVGLVSDRYGLSLALTLVPLFTLVSAVLYFLGSFYYDRDLAKVEKIELRVEQ